MRKINLMRDDPLTREGTIMFALSAWPTGGFAEMVVAVFDTEDEARAARPTYEARYPRWTFRITEAQRA